MYASGGGTMGLSYFGAKLQPANGSRHAAAIRLVLVPVLSIENMVFMEWSIMLRALTALPSYCVKRDLEKLPALLPPENVEGLNCENLAHADVA